MDVLSAEVEDEAPAQPKRYQVAAFVEMLVSSALGLVASLVLSIDAIALAKDPLTDLSCNISPAVSRGF